MLWSPKITFAQEECVTEGTPYPAVGGICLPLKPPGVDKEYNSLGELIGDFLQIALLIVGMVAVVFIVVGGYRYIMAGGDEEAVGSAKKTITSSVIGLIIVLFSYAIVRIVVNLATST